ncbi:MAG TPA: methionyl-tRNA formyltransferase [Candidatus Aminicenantes bacterium]|nr:methionyl-tRNA formyltransferase [Candidatus Aminicenantes bacterium]HRY65531.1 methionyl-tRNA formyltransferase [Candidatus Aminicenantes bacterium]HRZ72581.1 methionyl-tRNA formyltransferase [Candidatus Aminicenantes bacterium]
MRIVFFGSPASALPSFEALLAAGHTVALAVTQPDRPAGRGRRLTPAAVKAFARERGIPTIEPARIRGDEAALERIRAAAPDVNVVVAYGQIIPRSVHYFPPYHSLNVHFSLLPRYRGAAPVQWTVLNGEAESGVTIIELDDRMDEGDILARESVALRPRETAAALEARLAALGADLLVATLGRIDRIERLRQDPALATLAPKIRKEDGRLAWTDAAAAIDRKVMALAERPGVFTVFRGKRLGIVSGRPAEERGCPPPGPDPEPGTVLAIGKAGLEIACGAGTAYLVENVRPEGKSAMSAHAFSLGTEIGPGVRLGE